MSLSSQLSPYQIGVKLVNKASNLIWEITAIHRRFDPNGVTRYYAIHLSGGRQSLTLSEEELDRGFTIAIDPFVNSLNKSFILPKGYSFVPITPLPPVVPNFQDGVKKLTDAIAESFKDDHMLDALRYAFPRQASAKDLDDRFGSAPCAHQMKEYVGLREAFSYCVKCDHKETK